jgi:excisionase family DNA binding protein
MTEPSDFLPTKSLRIVTRGRFSRRLVKIRAGIYSGGSHVEIISVGKAAKLLGVPIRTIRDLTDAGRLPATLTAGGHRRYHRASLLTAYKEVDPGWIPPAVFERSYELAGLSEDQVWTDLQEALVLEGPARQIGSYAVTEMVNNAIDHSQGSHVSVRATDDGRVSILISDDGVGAFENMRSKLELPDQFASVEELSKGKQTTDPARHSGEGIFFTSKAVAVFVLEANGLRWIVDNDRSDTAVGAGGAVGTEVDLIIDRESTRTIVEVFDRFTIDGAFSRTRPVVKLFERGTEFVSRSEAKRLASGLEKFDEVELDFEGVDAVGQGFVDQLFRVWAVDNPKTALHPVRMNQAVRFMVERGLKRSADS